jgi:hypothetical protein
VNHIRRLERLERAAITPDREADADAQRRHEDRLWARIQSRPEFATHHRGLCRLGTIMAGTCEGIDPRPAVAAWKWYSAAYDEAERAVLAEERATRGKREVPV